MEKNFGKDYYGRVITEIENIIPPQSCVPWFTEHFKVGDRISFYDTDGGGLVHQEGIITRFENAELYVDGKSYLMGYITKVTKKKPLIKEDDFKYRVKLTINLGKNVDPDGRVSDMFTTRVVRGAFKYVEHAVRSLREQVEKDCNVTVGHIEIKGELTDGAWNRVVYLKQGDSEIKSCIALREEIWGLFKPYGELNTVS